MTIIAPAVQHRLTAPRTGATLVNDVHSQLNQTRVAQIVAPVDEEELSRTISDARLKGANLSVSGSRHAMGGQQFGMGTVLIDARGLNRMHRFDRKRGIIEVGAGMTWPQLVQHCHERQPKVSSPWTIAQKQSRADDFTLGGSLSANIHGRGLEMKPFVENVEGFTLMDANGEEITCSREENPELFRLGIGGYGLFGVITRVSLRLMRRQKLRRVVQVANSDTVVDQLRAEIDAGARYGDFQFSIDERSRQFLQEGILSTYRPIDDGAPVVAHRELSTKGWLNLLHLAYTNRAEAFRKYREFYLATNGQTYWSDLSQFGPYLPDYAAELRKLARGDARKSLMITELYVPPERLAEFMRMAAVLLRNAVVPVIYGTVRLIERDDETFLPWAQQRSACVVFNLLTTHTPDGVARSATVFRELIDLAASLHGTYYLTYHRYASREQVLRGHPRFPEFLARKLQLDPDEMFQSDWYRHYRREFDLPNPTK